MKRSLLFGLVMFSSIALYSQDCFKRLEDAFTKRGAYSVADDMHRNVIISFIEEDGTANCVAGKVRVENGTIVSIFLQYKDETYELMDKKFYNAKKMAPTITNGISELIMTADGEKLRVVFIEKLKPKAKDFKGVTLPDDL